MKDVLIENMDYVIRECPMPEGAHGMCLMDDENRANIYIRSQDRPERKKEAADHEIRHFAFDDFYLPEETAERLNRKRAGDVRIRRLETEDPDGDTVLKVEMIQSESEES